MQRSWVSCQWHLRKNAVTPTSSPTRRAFLGPLQQSSQPIHLPTVRFLHRCGEGGEMAVRVIGSGARATRRATCDSTSSPAVPLASQLPGSGRSRS